MQSTEVSSVKGNTPGLYGSVELVRLLGGDGKTTCNLACDHCYETTRDEELARILPSRAPWSELPCQYTIEALVKLSEAGFTQINLEGGEPTLFKRSSKEEPTGLMRVVKLSRALNLNTILSSHGMFLLEGSPMICEQLWEAGLNALSLSLDGASSSVNNGIRVLHNGKPSDQFEKACEFLRWYGKHINEPGMFDLKINSVVRQDNWTDLQNLGALLKEHLPPSEKVTIKLVQVQPRGSATDNFQRLGITTKVLERLAERVQQDSGFKVLTRSYDGGTYPFFVVTPDGFVVIPKGNRHEPVRVNGELLDLRDANFGARFESFLAKSPEIIAGNLEIDTSRNPAS